MKDKVILAYSGGLDTSVAVKWMAKKYDMDVIAFTVDIGGVSDLDSIKQKALKVGAIKAITIDARDEFVNSYVFPALQANAIYEGQYPLATALGRPLIAKLMVDAANEEGANAVAHGSTGKGNDQVRFDVSVIALNPNMKILAPAREWGMTREETIDYADKHGIPIPISVSNPYSIDENIWGRAIECGVLEDPWTEPPEDAFAWTSSITETPDEPDYIEIGFEGGIPVSLNGKKIGGVSLVQQVSKLAGKHGIGRIDHIESRLVGIKSREVYEAPAGTVLFKAHSALEAMTLSKEQLRFKERVAIEYADIIYNGLWFTSYRQDLDAFIKSSQRYVTGIVRLKLFKGNCIVVGRKSSASLYDISLATYDEGDAYDQSAALGFIHIWGLPAKIQSKVQDVNVERQDNK
jgi:argininosuccinate synthase